MSAETMRRIADIARAAREPGAGQDPSFFLRKAETFELMAAQDPNMAAECAELAAKARRCARELMTDR